MVSKTYFSAVIRIEDTNFQPISNPRARLYAAVS